MTNTQVTICGAIEINVWLHGLCQKMYNSIGRLTFFTALDLEMPGIPLSCLAILRPRTSCFCLLIFTSNGLTFFSIPFFLDRTFSAKPFFFSLAMLDFLWFCCQTKTANLLI